MSQLRGSFPYDQLRGMSFSQLYSLLVAITRWKWVVGRERSLVLRRALQSERMRMVQPCYAAVFLHEGGVAQIQQLDNDEWPTGALNNSR